jgi:streptomycin 6-kinase
VDLEISERLTHAIIFVRGQDEGAAWLRALPRRAETYARRWDLQLLEVAEGGAMSCCIFCTTAKGDEAVLKIPFDADSGRLESRSLKRWARTRGSPDVFETARSSGVFLMERVRPGTTATPSGQASDSERFCDLITRLTRPELGSMRHLRTIEAVTRMRFEWARDRFLSPGYGQETDRMSGVELLLEKLTAVPGRVHVIHGDLQSKNILVGQHGTWKAIDPFTCRGDLNAEAALWAVVQQDGSTIEERVAQLSECQLLDEGRLRAWCYIYGVAEYRIYMETHAKRMKAFTSDLDWRLLAGSIT